MTDEQNEIGEGELSLREIKEMRREYPSGWLELSMFESRALMVDALLETGPNYEFDHNDLSRRSGVTDESVRNHIGVLADLGLVDLVSEDGRKTYRVNEHSRVLFEIEELNAAVNAIRAGKPPSLTEKELRRKTASSHPTPGSLSLSFDLEMAGEATASEAAGDVPDISDIDHWPSPTSRQPPSHAGG